MTDQPRLPPKKDVALALLQTEMSVYVHLDPRVEGVRVPAWLKNQPQLVLQIGLNMAVPIPDLEVSEEAVACTLSFNRRPEYCYLPYQSIFGIIGEGGRGMIWPESVPPEVAAQAQGRATVGEAKGRQRPRLAAVPDPAGAAEEQGTRKAEEAAASSTAAQPSEVPEAHGSESPVVTPSSADPSSLGPSSLGRSSQDPSSDESASDQTSSSKAASSKAASSKAATSKAATSKAASSKAERPAGDESAEARAKVDDGPGAPADGEATGRSRKLPPYLRVVK